MRPLGPSLALTFGIAAGVAGCGTIEGGGDEVGADGGGEPADDRVPCTPSGESDAPLVPVALSTTPRAGGSPAATVLSIGGLGTIYDPPAADEIAAQVGRGLGIDRLAADGSPVRHLFASFSQHDDVGGAVQTFGVAESSDGGEGFGPPATGLDLPPTFALGRRDGVILNVAFKPIARVDSAAGTRLTLRGHESTDAGATWDPFEVTLDLPLMAAGGLGRTSGHPIELPDGAILLPYYLAYAGDPGWRAELLASTDGGRHFVRRGTIALPPAGVTYPEPDVVELVDGSLLAVFRHHVGADSTLSTLRQARSSDGGATWSAPADVRIAFGGAAAAPRIGINPQLHLMANGALALSSGRPDNFVAVSSAGDGEVWDLAALTYANHPTATTAGYGAAVLRYHGSSGNTGLVEVGPGRLAQIGDNCAASWGCPAADSGHPVDDQYRVWRRFVDVVTPDPGKIDLASKFRRCEIEVRTDLRWTSPRRPRIGPAAAFDGSTELGSSAMKAGGGGGGFTIVLDRRTPLTRVGLSLRPGGVAGAKVYAWTDDARWVEIAALPERRHRAIEYVDLPAPLPTTRVKVELDAIEGCDAELDGGCAVLNELELYSTIDSFENHPLGGAPRGYGRAVQAAVVAAPGASDSARVLRLSDTSAAAMAQVDRRFAPVGALALEFRVRPATAAWTQGLLFTVVGRTAGGVERASYHFLAQADGAIQQYDPTAAVWRQIAAAGTLPPRGWTTIALAASTTGGTLSVDGAQVALVLPQGGAITALVGHGFSSAGTVAVGGDFLIDDVGLDLAP